MNSKYLTLALSLGLTAAAQGAGYSPVPLTPSSFLYDTVVESNYAVLPAQAATTVTVDAGPANTGNTFFEKGCDLTALTAGLPAAGTIITNATAPDHTYQLPPSWAANNCVMVGPYTNIPAGFAVPYSTGVITFTSPAAYTALSFLDSAGNGPANMSMTVTHADSTVETFSTFQVADWFATPNPDTAVTPNAQVAYAPGGRLSASGNAFNNIGQVNGSQVWSSDVTLADTTSPVTTVTFTYTGTGGRAVFFAVSGSVGGGFTPIPISGFNADCVVEKTTLPLPYNATMDNGTNYTSGGGGANTWYEKGWDPLAPTTGFPVHGSTIVSQSTGRSYQMAASYAGPMSALIDTNHQIANITPVNPQPYTAFSLLTAGASINSGNTMTNIIVLQHQDGTTESNIFVGYDWFESNTNLSIAYIANGRVNFNNGRALNTVAGGNPKLFESQFQLANTTSPVTNIVLMFGSYPAGHANATTYVLAVSATAGGVNVVLNNATAAQNIYAGQTAHFSANLQFGSTPSYQWQVSTTGAGGPFSNLTDGGNIAGSQTLNLSVANVTAGMVGNYYQLVATNAVSTNTSIPALLTLLTSTSSNVVAATDAIFDFGGYTNSPLGEGAAALIDHDLNKYVNFGSTQGITNFAGPISVVVTPGTGATILNALRFFVADSNPERDPADYTLEGSNDGGNTYSAIASGALALPNSRNFATNGLINATNQVLQEVDFANATSYSTYRITFNNTKNSSIASELQLAEIQFLGVLSPIAPGITQQPTPGAKVFTGANVSATVAANGPQPIAYQWYNGASPVGPAGPTLTLNNVTVGNSGTYNCHVSNTYGTTISSDFVLTVLATPAGYAQTIMTDHPLAFWRFDESEVGGGDYGVILNDYEGGHNGIYTNVVLGVQGFSTSDPDTAALFGTLTVDQSLASSITGINFAAPTNVNATFSVEAWVMGTQPQIFAGAGIITSGLGGGGEQFALDCGGSAAPQNGFRFYFRDAAGTSHTVNSTVNTGDNKWHHLVGVLDEANNKETLYVDGQVAQSVTLAANLGVLAENSPTNVFIIGARSSAVTNLPSASQYNLQFIGTIDESAVYNYALTAAQVQNHYFAGGIAAGFSLAPTNTIADEHGSTTLFSAGSGTPPLTYQWYLSDGSNPTTAISGQTSSNLALVNLTAGITYYQVIVSNVFGATTSPAAYVNAISGGPQIFTDLQAQYTTSSGFPITLNVGVFGTAPLTYGWYLNGNPLTDSGRITGTHSNVLSIATALQSDSGNYQLFVTNASGTAQSAIAAVTVLSSLSFNGLGQGWTTNGGGSFTTNNVLQLTYGVTGTAAASSFFNTQVKVDSFQATWTYTDIGGGGADGYAFVLQNDPRGVTAVGAAGGGLGFTGISPSVGLEFDIYAANTPGYAFQPNGLVVTPYTPTTPVDVSSGHPINTSVIYHNGKATMTVVDTVTSASFTAGATVDIAGTLGTNLAYVGFTGAEGGTISSQIVSNFRFENLLALTPKVAGSQLVITWPIGVGNYQLQSNANLTTTNWVNVATTPTVVGGQNQATVPVGAGNNYYRLQLQ